MEKLKLIIWVVIVLFVVSCGSGQEGAMEEKIGYEAAEEVVQKDIPLESKLNLEAHQDKKFIQTADIKFKVKDVFDVTMTIEDLVVKHNGYIAYTNLQNQIQTVEAHQISADSSLEITSYIMENQLRVKVPSTNLQKFLRALNQSIDFPNHRIIEAKDVSLEILAKELTQERLQDFGNKTENINTPDSLKNEKNQLLLTNQEQRDNNLIVQKNIEDQIKFSTVTMYIYQNPKVSQDIIAIIPQDYPKYEPAFSTQALQALSIAWTICKYMMLLIIGASPFLVIGVLAYLFRGYLKRWKFN